MIYQRIFLVIAVVLIIAFAVRELEGKTRDLLPHGVSSPYLQAFSG